MGFFHEAIDHLEGRTVKHMLTMQDISNWQGPNAPEAVAKHEVLAIKASEGNNFDDPDFGTNWAFAKDQEKARVAYHLLHPSIPGLQQAAYFLDQLNRFGIESGDLFAVDLELTDHRTPSEVAQCAKEFCDHVAAITKANPIVYTFRYFAESGNCAGLENRPLWIADPSNPPAKPQVPSPWTSWLMHQYGVFRGIDADVVNVESVDALIKYGALIGKPEPPPDIVVVTLNDGSAETEKEFHESTTLKDLRGTEIKAGTATLTFSK